MVGIQFLQQGPQQAIVLGRHGAGVDVVEKASERFGDLRVAPADAHICFQSSAPMHHRPGVVPHDGDQRVRNSGNGRPGSDRIEDQEDKRLMCLIARGIGQSATEFLLQTGIDEASQWRVQRGVSNQPRIPLGLLSQGLEYQRFLARTEVLDVAVENHSERVAFDDFVARRFAVGCQPGGETAEFGDDAAIEAGHQRKDSSSRKPLGDQACKTPRRNKLGDLSVYRNQAAFGRRTEQIGAHHAPKELLVPTGNLIHTRVIRVRHSPGKGDSSLARQEQESAEIAGTIQQQRRGDGTSPRDLVLGILLGDEPSTRHVERLGPGRGPFAGLGHRLREHSQILRIGEQVLYSALPGLGHERARIVNAVVLFQDLENPLIRKRIEPHDPQRTVWGNRLETLPVVCAEPVCFPAGKAEPGAPGFLELPPDVVEGRASVRGA